MHLRGYVNHVSAPMFYEHNFFFWYGLLLLKPPPNAIQSTITLKFASLICFLHRLQRYTSNQPQFFFLFVTFLILLWVNFNSSPSRVTIFNLSSKNAKILIYLLFLFRRWRQMWLYGKNWFFFFNGKLMFSHFYRINWRLSFYVGVNSSLP